MATNQRESTKMTTATAAEVHGIDKKLLDEAAVDEAIAHLKIEVPKRADLPKKVGLLKGYFEAAEPKDLSECDNCGTTSLTSLPRCPFCGVGEQPNGAANGSANGAMVLRAAPGLDQYVLEVKAMQDRTAADGWLLAKKIAEGMEADIQKARTNDKGVPVYKTYESFAAAELGMSRKYVHGLVQIAKEFPDPGDEVKRLGTTKLRLLVTAPPEKKAELLERVKQGEKIGRRQLQAETGRKPDDKPKKGKKETMGQTITVAAIEGKRTVKLYAKPATKADFDVKTARAAKRLDDMPWGWLDMTNDVRLTFTLLKNAAGELILRTNVQRVDA